MSDGGYATVAMRAGPRNHGRMTTAASARLVWVAVALAALFAAVAPTALAQTPAKTNPLAGMPWGVYSGTQDGVHPAWQKATGTPKTLLAKVALRPRARWYGSWITTHDIRAQVRDDIVLEQQGDPNVVVPMAMFRLWPHHESHKDDPLSPAARQAYRNWVSAAARGIGSARVLMILEPDLPVALNGWRPSVRLRLVNYAARTFGALPNATVYLDGGGSDWLTAAKAASMLEAAGVSHVRGFALDGTHYTSTSSNLVHGRQILAALAQRGFPGKHFVVDTSDNGHPFTYAWYYRTHPPGPFGGAAACKTKTQHQCVALGIPPTTHVAAAAWHLPTRAAGMARRWCDAYVWYNRPWLKNGTYPFQLDRTLAIARTSPF
jgi:hypothetical protein